MKQNLSVLALLARGKLYRLLLLLAGVAAVNGMGYYGLPLLGGAYFSGDAGRYFTLITFALAYGLCTLLCVQSAKKSQFGYTLQRLRISERAVFLWDCLICILCFAAVTAVEVLMIYGLSRLWTASGDYTLGLQGVQAALLRNDLFHGLIPIGERGLWTRNALYVTCAGILAAEADLSLRQGRRVATAFAVLAVAIATRFSTAVGKELYLFLALILITTAILMALCLSRAKGGKERKDDEEFTE